MCVYDVVMITYIYNIYIYIQSTEADFAEAHFAGAKGIQVFASPLAL